MKDFELVNNPSITVIGISIRTENNDGKAAIDIGGLWEKWFKENIAQKLLLY